MKNFWAALPTPFFVLAPMEDVTDIAFRTLIAQYSARSVPRVFYTEFTSADGLIFAKGHGKERLLKKLAFGEGERPIVAQLFTANPEHMEKGAALCRELGFDGFDINMGCPVNEVVRQQCGAALIQNPPLARELIKAAKRGAGEMPVSVKTRIGFNINELETWLPELLAEEPAVVTIHARTRKEMSAVPARWEHIRESVAIRDRLGSKTRIVGNGDVKDLADAREKVKEAGADGAMLGRAVFGNPWIFSDRSDMPTKEEKIQRLIDHIDLFQEHLTGFTNDALMKKHFKAYISGWDHAAELRAKLMDAPTLGDAKALLALEL